MVRNHSRLRRKEGRFQVKTEDDLLAFVRMDGVLDGVFDFGLRPCESENDHYLKRRKDKALGA